MSGVKTLLLEQKAQLSAKLPPLEADRDQQRSALAQTMNEIAAVQQEIRRIELALQTVEDDEARSARPTIMQAVLDALKDKPDGMTALEILAEINERNFAGRMVRTSLSPQLSRLKDRDHKIKLHGNRWYLIDEEEPTLFTSKS